MLGESDKQIIKEFKMSLIDTVQNKQSLDYSSTDLTIERVKTFTKQTNYRRI